MQMKDLAAYFFPFLKIFQKSDCIPVLLFNDFVGYHASLTAQLLRASLLRMDVAESFFFWHAYLYFLFLEKCIS